jgi:hypothetical protein
MLSVLLTRRYTCRRLHDVASQETVSFRFVVLPCATYLFTAGVKGFYFSLDHTQTHTIISRTTLDKGSARRRDFYLTTQTLYKRQTSMLPVGFQPTIPASARSQTCALDGAATGLSNSAPWERQIAIWLVFRGGRSLNVCKKYEFPPS